MPEKVDIVEVGPRDGLQNEPGPVSVEDKTRLIRAIAASGIRRIEAASFVSPKWVPQMANSSAVVAAARDLQGIRISALVPNERGLDEAISAGVNEVAVFAAATESFSRANINCSIDESFERYEPIVKKARSAGLLVRGYVSCATHCPYEGQVAPTTVAKVVDRLFGIGAGEVSLGETLGRATPTDVEDLLASVLKSQNAVRLAGHFHDTSGLALQNIDVCLVAGLRVFDSSVGGLGGCPYAPGAAGNLATESLVRHLHALGYKTGVDATKLSQAADFAKTLKGGSHANA